MNVDARSGCGLLPESRKQLLAMITTKGWVLEDLLEDHKFLAVPRKHYSQITEHDIAGYERGHPLIIEGLHRHPNWNTNFTPEFYRETLLDPHTFYARNVHDSKDSSVSINDFLTQCRTITPCTYEGETTRLYAKDAPCPENWKDWLHSSGVIPRHLIPEGDSNLSMNLPMADRIETLMCYLGVGDTYTPFHKDLCASAGHNIMCYAEGNGSSFWFMTEGSSSPDVAHYFRAKFEAELDCERFPPTPDQLKGAPFPIYAAEQKVGDLVLVPPRSAHQVVNKGGLTVKTSWSRMTIRSIEAAIYHELHLYRRACRPEIYRTKMTLYWSLRHKIQTHSQQVPSPANIIDPLLLTVSHERLADLQKLIEIYDFVLRTEYLPAQHSVPVIHTSIAELDSQPVYFACDVCAADIFNGYFECSACVHTDGSNEFAMICSGCYLEGRNCRCGSCTPKRVVSFDSLVEVRQQAVEVALSWRSSLPTSAVADIPINLDTSVLFETVEPAIFWSATLLFQKRKPQPTMKCQGLKKAATHETRSQWLVRCEGCHAAICFQHLLGFRSVHVLDALLVYERDKDHAQFHNMHKQTNSGDKYPELFPTILDVQRDGGPWPTWGSGPTFSGFYLTSVVKSCLFSQFDWSKPIQDGFYDGVMLSEVGDSPATPSPSKKRKRQRGVSSPQKRKRSTPKHAAVATAAEGSSSLPEVVPQPPPVMTLQSILGVSQPSSTLVFGKPNFGGPESSEQPLDASYSALSPYDDQLRWPPDTPPSPNLSEPPTFFQIPPTPVAHSPVFTPYVNQDTLGEQRSSLASLPSSITPVPSSSESTSPTVVQDFADTFFRRKPSLT